MEPSAGLGSTSTEDTWFKLVSAALMSHKAWLLAVKWFPVVVGVASREAAGAGAGAGASWEGEGFHTHPASVSQLWTI